ncbi:hypothetical protein ENKNEFLB_03285 [Nocardioides aquaticus]|uniref:Phospholipase D-like domain-containing protein n=1 Tax=Nocardioides aquaticus TaxID=160826 RepID=A0ABX8EKU2_9ACTN|nr:phospholipase D-like domain-containing protein [Nocardioides aquaticus]QVT80884.1 hypothetical protein ENKNEFLB_03285 [Nocardioides aquaticus]
MQLMKHASAIAVAAVAGLLVSLVGVPAASADYTPRDGITFNNAYGDRAAQNAILSKVYRSIRATPRGAQIDIMSWNFNSTIAVRTLLAAQERGVRVRLLQSRGNVSDDGRDDYAKLRAGLQRGNQTADVRSWARACRQSCRGRGGAAHAKFFLFSETGNAEKVLMQGSANLTSTSGNNQWNDVQTFTNRPGPYDFALGVFEQMAQDKALARPYTSWRSGRDQLAFFPGADRRSPDPVMQLLDKVRCQGATNTASGRTRIRIAPDVMREDRGMRLARKVRSLWVGGCDVRIGYTVMGLDVGRMLRQPSRRGPVPLAHMVRDTNNDGQFDDYFHMKSMAVVGNVAGKRNGYATLNGSQNWSDVAARSDENIGVTYRAGITKQYSAHIDRWYRFFDRNGANRYSQARQARSDGRIVDGFLFGTGPIDGVDPYANLEMD